ncbi:hypothetical protein DL766_002630 [Monosporascus sp. MC13-8B]|uniref:Uncharacterized protein n=1 Tax=Monosporascus cannonballus TaxID=155416 RepID=A0ABY0HBR6_9PEZI|nr:hypothetical protein DL762_003060 [Monosporascus cannonballus]RYO90288.1 hypothetical protein DL763_005372 [Monosporascus cannonballus]RYP35183.1 hypothetical protein DL766_002630 [Monosporascus sp. MC13-8B]
MKGRPIEQLVYECMFPKPRTTDPQNFHSLLHRNLIPEVRQEVHSFYGHLDTQEAKYPGLDYTHHIHRIRLSRWPWHRRLFRAFDALRLTHAEISGLTKWEGTKWAKERFERDSGITIRDTAADGFPNWIEPEDRPRAMRATLRAETEDTEEGTAETADEGMDGEEDSEGELESIGVALNERLRERAARREAGDTSEPLDEEWEQWLKNAIDSGELPFLAEHLLQQSNDATRIPQIFFPPQMLSAARAGQWQDIPEFLHDMLRRTIATESGTGSLAPPSSASPSNPALSGNASNFRRAYSELRLPVGDAATSNTSDVRLQRTARPGA